MNNTLKFQFSGCAELKSREINSKEQMILEEELIPQLNHMSIDISDEILRELKRSFPPGLKVDVGIDFSPGSIEWVGIVYVLDWMARLGSTIGLLDYMKKAIELSVNRVLRKRIRRMHPISSKLNDFSTEVLLIPEIDKSITIDDIMKQNPQDKVQVSLLVANTVLLVVILIFMIASRYIGK